MGQIIQRSVIFFSKKQGKTAKQIQTDDQLAHQDGSKLTLKTIRYWMAADGTTVIRLIGRAISAFYTIPLWFQNINLLSNLLTSQLACCIKVKFDNEKFI